METNSSMLHHLQFLSTVGSVLSWCYIFLESEFGFAKGIF